ncbi:MAG: M20 family metallopeptidase [Deltaproteobacteria bacterium]|nr:M20 family metallopeptidase [Deltaproteobacteria bacterium]
MSSALRELVEQTSFTDDREGVSIAQRLFAQMATELGAAEHVGSPSSRYAHTLVLHGNIPASEGGVVLVGHMDTVFPRDVFAGYREEGERARGPGVLDMKGGLIVCLWALRAALREQILARLPWTLVVVADEEVGSPESTEVLQACASGARAALVFESGRAHDRVVTARKGTGSLTVEAFGVAAHAGNAHAQGKNALWALARFIDRAQSLTDYDSGITINTGKLSGGTSKNTVPDYARAELDLRYVHPEQLPRLRAALAQCAQDNSVEGTRVVLTDGPGRAPLVPTEGSRALLARYAQCQRLAGLGDGENPLVGGGSDASTTSAMGVPSLDALGVRGEGFHTLNEYAELRTLGPKAEALARFLAEFSDEMVTP